MSSTGTGGVSGGSGPAAGGASPSGAGTAGNGGSSTAPPAVCNGSYEAETMQASTGEAIEGGWNIYSQGTLGSSHAFKGGLTKLTVHARGTAAGGTWPHMVVRVGSSEVGAVDVSSEVWSPYEFSTTLLAGSQPIQIEFTNDGVDGAADRNLYVDKLEISEPCNGGAPVSGGAGANAGGAAGSGGAAPVDAGNPFSTPLHVDGDSPAASAARSSSGSDAELLNKIAMSPQATWIGGWSGDPAGAVQGALDQAAGKLRVLVAYNIYNRDCGNMSAGGAADATAYKSWIDGFANGIGDRKVAIILEPDTLAHECDATRWEVLAYAVSSLKKKANAHVYIDAGHAGWVPEVTMAMRLKTAGIATADGFSLNVASFQTTDASVAYGTSISGQVGGKPFVIDTGRNGKGPAGAEWCNPPGRGLGERPTGATGKPLVHAFLWIKRPGESDGTCNGGPAAGQWFQAYALELARNAVF